MNAENGNEPLSLIQAAKADNIKIIEKLLSRGAAIDAPDSSGKTALTHAAFYGRTKTVALLLAHGAKLDAKDNYGGTPLFWAVCGAHVESVKLLTKHGADFNAQNNNGQAPLMRAASGLSRPGHVPIMQHFLDLGADVNHSDDRGVTLLIQAVSAGAAPIVLMLLEHGADVNAKTHRGETALVMACRAHKTIDPEIVQKLIARGARINVKDQWKAPLLSLAAQNGHTPIIGILLDHGCHINEDNGLPIRNASATGHLNTVTLLIQRGADVNLADADGRTALMSAVSKRHNQIARALIEAGADVNAVTQQNSWGGDQSVLMFALGIEDSYQYERCKPPKIDKTLIQLLLENGADADYRNHAGITPVHLARKKKNTQLIGLLKAHSTVG